MLLHVMPVILYKSCCYSNLILDTELESCEKERGILKRRLVASAVEIERQVIRIPD